MKVEVGEENYEGSGVSNQRVMHPFWKVAVDVQGVHAVDYSQRELQLCTGGGGGGGGGRRI